jgi:hypothetical protein
LRVAKWVLFLLGCAVALSPFAVAIAAWRAEARLAEVVADIASRGDPLMPADLVRPPIPDEENAALVYEQAFEVIELSEEDEELLDELRLGKSSLDNPGVRSRASDILRRNVEALELIHRAADMPRCDFRLDWSKGYDVELPHLAKLRTCARLLAFESLMLLDAGKVDEAAECCVTAFHSASAADEPSLTGQWVRYAIIGIGWGALEVVLREAQVEADVCRRLAGDIAQTDLASSLVEALKGERVCARGFFARLRLARDPWDVLDQAPEEMGPLPSGEQVRPAGRERPSYFARWWLARDELEYLKRMEVGIREASRPYREAAAAVEGMDWLPVTYVPPPAVVTQMLIPVFDRSFASRDRAIAQLRLAEVALLLKAHRAESGRYPESLAELGESAGRELPADPFSGKPLVYEREGDGFLLYSLGPNLEDDGGVAAERRVLEEGDIVMRCLR